MGAGWIAQGPDTPAPTGADAPQDPWTPIAPDAPSTPALIRPHQDPNAHPVDNTRGLLTKTKQLLFGHEPESSQDPDQHYQAGIVPSVAESVGDSVNKFLAPGPDTSTLMHAYPHLLGAQVEKLKAGYQETTGAAQVQSAEQTMAALNVLPQVAARYPMPGGVGVNVEAMAKDPAVKKTAIKLGIDPTVFAGQWAQYSGMGPEQQADAMAAAKEQLDKGAANRTSGTTARATAWADERAWAPADLMHGKLDPWSLKGIAFNTALAIPELGAVFGTTLAGTAVGGPGVGVAAGGATAVALFAPAQREEAKDKIDDQVSNLLQRADALDEAAPVGSKRGLNPQSQQLRQAAADLAASSDKIANTAGVLYAVADAAGAVPVSSVLSKSPIGKAMLDRMVGAAASKTVGGRIGGAMVANGAGGILQASIQKAVDVGIVHENTPLSDALKDIAYTGIIAVTTAGLVKAGEERAGAPGRAREAAKAQADELRDKYTSAGENLSAGPKPAPGEEYPGYKFNEATKRYEPTDVSAPGGSASRRLAGPSGPAAAAPGGDQGPAAGPTAGASGARAAYQAKTDALNEAAAKAEKRSDVSLQPEEEGWSVHVKGEPVATFETAAAAREAMATARKLVGTKPAEPETKEPERATEAPISATKAPSDETEAGESAPRTPETPLEKTQPIEPPIERRTAAELRQRVATMTPEQMKAALLTHDLTGIPNRRAYEDSPKKAVQASVDVDSLKWINDHASHEGGDHLLKTVAQALHEESGGNAYHISGDEFVVQGDSHEEADAALLRAKDRLSRAVLTFKHPDGRTVELTGVGLSHGTGTTLEEAERTLQQVKSGRQSQGVRAARGEQPPNARIAPREAGLPAGGGEAAAKGQELAPNGKPRIKERTSWHGLPIGIENPAGSFRTFKMPSGESAKRKMRVPYGEFTRTEGADGDGVDVFMAGNGDKAHVIDQLDHTGRKFDEHKVILGASSMAEAKQLYLDHYQKGWKGFGGITELDANQLKRWLKEGDLDKPIDVESVPREKAVRGPGPDPRHDSVLEFLARHPRGIDSEEAGAQGIDAADMALSRAHVGIKRAFRKGGLSFDHAAEALHEAGYPVDDDQGNYSPNALLDKIDTELRGTKVYSSRNQTGLEERAPDWRLPLSDEELAKLTVAQTMARIEALQQEQERLEREIERAGLNEESSAETADELDNIPFMRKGGHPGVQQDLFSQANQVKNEIKRLETELDKKRSSGQESVETGRPDDLFSQARKQTDLTDQPTSEPAQVSKSGALDDAGVKIGGARKDRWAERGMRLSDLSDMTETEAAGLVNKKAVWNPKWEALIAGGMPRDVAALAKVLIDQLGAKPRNNTPQGRRDYVQALGLVRNFIEKAKSTADLQGLEGHLVRELGVPTGYALASTPEQMRARDIFWSIQKGRRSTLRVAHSDLSKVRKMIEAGWPEKAAPVEPVDDGKPKEDKAGPKRPHLDRIERVGPPVRNGDVTSSDFIKDFGFRGLEFGNWAANDERQRLMNHAYEGLHDLARAMGLPPQALALNGTMGLALGARGGGRFAAHYEPGRLVINMTKINGAGALAHEWGHALDHYLGELGRPDAYTTDARGASGWYKDPGTRTLAHLRPEMQQAFGELSKAMFKKTITAAEHVRDTELGIERAESQKREIVEAMKERPQDTNLVHRLDWVNGRIETWKASRQRALDNPEGEFGTRTTKYASDAARLGEYWRRPTEMFARAFEAFIFDKLKSAGQQSDYLVHGNEAATYERNPKGNPYPAEDRPAINAAMQKLADTLEVHGEKSAIREMDLPAAGAETTHYAVREPSPSATKAANLRSAAGVPQLDLFANAAAPAPATQAARLAQSVKLAHIGEFRSGVKQVKTWADAAHILAPLRKNPQENMTALVLDKTGKPLAVIRHSVGASDSANVEPWSLAGSIVQVPGASSVFFAHNHPSGFVSQSGPDQSITRKLHNLLEGTGILPRGMIVVGPNSRTASYFLPESGASDFEANIPAARRSGMVPMLERRYARLHGDIGPLTGQSFRAPDAAKEAIIKSGEKSGVVLANQRHQIVGIVPMSRDEMSKLRTGDPAHGAARLLKAMSEANSNTIIAFGPRAAGLNVAIFASAAGARALDVMHWENGGLVSAAVSNNMPNRMHENFLQRGEGPAAGRGMSIHEVRAQVDKILAGFSVKPGIVVAKDLAELQADPAFSFDLAPYQDGDVTAFMHPPTGKIYLIADQFTSPGALATTLAHEYITHYGLRAAFGNRDSKKYQEILDGVAKAMPAELRARGEKEFSGFNPLNAHHRNVAAEEVLAYYGQRYANDQSVPKQAQRWLDRLLGMLRDWLRSVLGLPQKFDELFVKRTLADLESFLRRGRSDAKGRPTQGEPAFAHPQDTFFSGLARAVDAAKRDKGTGAEWEATLRNMPGVKAEELQWVGLKDWLDGRGRVSKDEVAEFVHAHTVQLDEVERGTGKSDAIIEKLHELGFGVEESVHGEPILLGLTPETQDEFEHSHEVQQLFAKLNAGSEAPPKYSQWATPGGNNYRELLLTLPETKELAAAREAAHAKLRAHAIAETDARTYTKLFAELAWRQPANAPEVEETFLKTIRANDSLGFDNLREATRAIMDHKDWAERWDITDPDAIKAIDKGRAYRLQREGVRALPDLLAAAAVPDSSGALVARNKLQDRVDVLPPAFKDDAQSNMDNAIKAYRRAYDLSGDINEVRRIASEGAGYQSQHWDEQNVLAHIRFDDRTGPNGERVLHIHEIQSDWHQEGRRSGYMPSAAQRAEADAMIEKIDAAGGLQNLSEEDQRRSAQLGGRAVGTVPDAPFKTTWPELAMKRMLRYAAEHGYDALSWDTGDTNAERYNMSHVVDRLEIGRASDGYYLKGTKENAVVVGSGGMTDEKLAAYIGKDLAQKAIQKIEENQATGRRLSEAIFTGSDLKVGGAGMRGFYDDILPKTVQRVVKKWGSSVEPGTVNGEGGHTHADIFVNGELTESEVPRSRLVAATERARMVHPDAEIEVKPYARYELQAPLTAREGAPVNANPRWVAYQPGDQYDYKEFETEQEARSFIENQKPEGESIPAHVVRVTPAMRDSVMAGQPMFQKKLGDYAIEAARKAREEREATGLPFADPLSLPHEDVNAFLKRRKGSSGTPAPAPKKGAYSLARRAIAAIPNNEFTLALRRIADPAGVSEASRATAIVTREALGELAQASEQALKDLEQYSKQFDLLSIPDRYEFIDAMEGGKPTRPDLQPAGDAIRKLLDGWRENIRGLGVGALDNFIENYFPHIWQRDDRAKKVFGQIFGRRPLKGPASFLKERTIPTTREGLDAGLQPISSNPLVLAFAKLREMMRFYTGVKLMQRYKDEGLAKFLPATKLRPDGWAEINDAVGRVRQWSEVEQGFIERGKYIMPEDAARVINNHLSASALRNFLPAQVFRVMSNAVNALQLGFSAFHLGFTTLDAAISKNALAIERMLHGEPLRAVAALLEASTIVGGAGMNIVRGHKLLKAYSNLSGATPQMRRIVEGLMAAGGRIKMDNYFQAAQGLSPFKGVGFATLASDVKAALTQPQDKVQALTQTLTSFPQQYAMRLWRDLSEVWRLEPLKILPIMSALEIAGRMTRASTSIIMEHIVPLQKLGVFSDLAADHIRRNPLEDPVAFADAMQKIWNSVDNRLGEMVYDNVFWNRTFKDVNHMLVRAVGWNLGTIRELGGAPIDVIKVLDYMARGVPAELPAPPLNKTSQARLDYEAQKSKFQRIAEKVGHKIPYTLALLATTMILGAILTRLFTGKDPEDLKDYFFPWTGRKTKYGTKERISMPSYTKDLYEYATMPMTTIINKANPIFGIAHSIYANEDFFGNAVRNPDKGFWEQLVEGAKYASRQVQPFSLQGTKQFVGAGEMDTTGKILSTMPYVGFGPAPARVTSPEQMERYQLREKEKSYLRGLQRRLKAARTAGDKEEEKRLLEEIHESKVTEKGTERDIRQDKVKAIEAAKKISSLIQGRSRDDAAAELTKAGLPAFAELWRSLPEHPRPRVAESLEGFA